MFFNQSSAQKSWKLGHIRGHEIRVGPLFLILMAIFVFMGMNSAQDFFYQLMWAPVLFFSVLFHELGHAAASKHYGFGTSQIVLHGMGGVAISRRGYTSPKQGMVIALAGPAVTFLLAAGAAVLLFVYGMAFGSESLSSVPAYFLRLMIGANIFWLIFNLLPIYPLDGGQTLMHFLRRKNPQHTALEKTVKASLGTLIVAGLLTWLLLGGGSIFIFFIFAMLGFSNYQILQQLQR